MSELTVGDESDGDLPMRDESDGPIIADGTHEKESQEARPKAPIDPVASNLINPLSTGQSEYTTAPNGRLFYLGTSSNWSFTRRVLNITHQYVHKTSLPTNALLFDGTTYVLDWDGYRASEVPEMPALPTQDYAIYLVNAVKFHCGQMFHLFDEETFMKSLYSFYSDPNPRPDPTDPWFIHFLLILSFGKAFTTKTNRGNRPPGHDFFVKAMQLLPDFNVLLKNHVLSTEIMCCIALYTQCIDFRHCSYNYRLGEAYVERCRRLWWTVHILDREITSLFGMPPSIHDDYVLCQLPTYSGSVQRTAALRMRIRLSKVIGSINRKVYGLDGRLNNKFMLGTKEVLASVAEIADELQQSFALPLERDTSCISRTSAHLHLLHHQCIVLATRPLLFCFLKIRFESQKTFLPFDLEASFVSASSLLLGPAIDPQCFECLDPSLEKVYSVLDEMIMAGNGIAKYRKSELQQLENMLQRLTPWPSQASEQTTLVDEGRQTQPPDDTSPQDTVVSAMASEHSQHESYSSSIPGNMDEMAYDSGLTMAQLLDMANSIEQEDSEWMSQTIVEHSIW
ncbi:hypothetical protein CTAM01_12313 [Colletotrichum tamarilloi]|uniref:Xylanolytic transcriptional activator regulatory domain-containing protein n=1 Tax=Colletotrichum tamarilloi TaxID=1209934 RepID=A0ABQ9QVN6_9PEZI|nr:uncharacterized protein CTAM01_12313 [Colletotrichum tamarilloi]KAK1486262.1 hypothetical protein CTAM01_12313 [Colletotrichum tamarilloi]